MKRVIVATAAIFALAAGSAYAGGGCNYGSHAAMDETESPVMASVNESADPKLLANLAVKEETEALEKLIEMPVIHN